MLRSTFKTEKGLTGNGYNFVIGIDEAGRGPLAGPVVASAVVLKTWDSIMDVTDDPSFELIRDSKTLSEKQREKALLLIEENFHIGIGICSHDTIDRINILEATYLAMKKALTDLASKINRRDNCIILVDGNKIIPSLSLEQRAIIGGDGSVKSISAASIVAKVTRDRIMKEMHKKYPEYGFTRHKGYGTKYHLEKINLCGACPIHRLSFRPFSKG